MSNIPAIPRRDFFEIQADLEKVTAKLKGAKDPDASRKLLREMRALLGEASRGVASTGKEPRFLHYGIVDSKQNPDSVRAAGATPRWWAAVTASIADTGVD